MDLGETRIGEERPLFVGAIGRGHIAAPRIRRKVKDISVTSGGKHDRIAGEHLDFSSAKASGDDALRVTIDDDEIEHLGLGKHLHRARRDLARQRGITPEQQLLAGLAARIKRAGNLRAAKRAVREEAAVFAREWHALGNALIYDIAADFGQPVNICLARSEITTLDRVVKQSINAVAIVLIIFRGVNSSLRRDRVGATRGILVTKTFYPIAEFAKRGRGGASGQT